MLFLRKRLAQRLGAVRGVALRVKGQLDGPVVRQIHLPQVASLNVALAGPMPEPAFARFWPLPHSLPRWNFQRSPSEAFAQTGIGGEECIRNQAHGQGQH